MKCVMNVCGTTLIQKFFKNALKDKKRDTHENVPTQKPTKKKKMHAKELEKMEKGVDKNHPLFWK